MWWQKGGFEAKIGNSKKWYNSFKIGKKHACLQTLEPVVVGSNPSKRTIFWAVFTINSTNHELLWV
jgi:hypothetical protein